MIKSIHIDLHIDQTYNIEVIDQDGTSSLKCTIGNPKDEIYTALYIAAMDVRRFENAGVPNPTPGQVVRGGTVGYGPSRKTVPDDEHGPYCEAFATRPHDQKRLYCCKDKNHSGEDHDFERVID